MPARSSESYRASGVDVDAANKMVSGIRRLAKSTQNQGVANAIGTFAAIYDPKHLKIKDPLLVSSTDGVGTKLELAELTGRHDSIGIDLVAMCVNDLICTGARPLFFLDYFACGKLNPKQASKVLAGIAKGCQQSDCSLIGGETAEMPGFYEPGRYDLAGFSVGMVDRKKVIDGSTVRANDLIIGLGSSGFHSNGFSLLRKIYSRKQLAGPLGLLLLKPTRIYVRVVLGLIAKVKVKGIAHITGGSFQDKLCRIVPDGLVARLDAKNWKIGKVFKDVARDGHIPAEDMFTTFNMGIGLCLIIRPQDKMMTFSYLKSCKIPHWQIGTMVKGAGEKVEILNQEIING